MARGDWDHFVNWAREHELDFQAPDVQDVYYSWVEIFSSRASWSDPESIAAFHDFLVLAGFTEEEIEDILEQYADE